MGPLFGSAGAHTYLKSGQVATPPPLADAMFGGVYLKFSLAKEFI